MIEERFQCGFFAFQAYETDSRMRNELKNRIQHAQPGSQDGDEHYLALQLKAARLRERSPDRSRIQSQGPGRFIQQQSRDFSEHPAKFLRPGAFIPQPRQIVLNQRVRDEGHAFHFSEQTRGPENTTAPLATSAVRIPNPLLRPGFRTGRINETSLKSQSAAETQQGWQN